MDKKSMVVAILLSFFLAAGGFYAAGLKKGLILFIGTIVVAWALAQVSPSAAIVGNLIACFISGEALLGVVHLLALFLDIAIVVVPILALTKNPYDVDPEVLAEKEDREK